MAYRFQGNSNLRKLCCTSKSVTTFMKFKPTNAEVSKEFTLKVKKANASLILVDLNTAFRGTN